MRITSQSDYLLQFGKVEHDDGEMSSPNGLTVHNSKVYVADYCNNRISVFHTDGKFHDFHHTIGRGHLGHPYDVAATSNKLLVADYRNNCIYKFTLDGVYISRISNHGDMLYHPLSITTDPNNFILVTDTFSVIFDPFGNVWI